jgi:hypothetical protein
MEQVARMGTGEIYTKFWSENLEGRVISVGFWRWCVSIERIVLLDFIHRLVSQKTNKIEELKI